MTEKDFLKIYKKRNRIKNQKEAKEKIDNFWKALLKAISKDKKVVFKNWGVFEEKDIKSRKIVLPTQKEVYSQSKKILKFRAGRELIKSVNTEGGDNE